MIVKITQNASNVKQLYYIDSDTFNFDGELGNLNKYQDITLSNENTIIKGVYKMSKWTNYFPFLHLFGIEQITRHFLLSKNEQEFGSICHSQHGLYKNYYVISFKNKHLLYCYTRSIGSFNYVSIYYGNKQIALIETLLNVEDFKYTHKLYILDKYNDFAEILTFFALYYSNFAFTQRFHMSIGNIQYVKSWSFSMYNKKYDSTWREKHFPDENYWGKTSIFSN